MFEVSKYKIIKHFFSNMVSFFSFLFFKKLSFGCKEKWINYTYIFIVFSHMVIVDYWVDLLVLQVLFNYFILLFPFFKVYWNILDLQCCDNFCRTTMWITYTWTHVYSHSRLFPTQIITEYWTEFSMLFSKSPLVNHSIYFSVSSCLLRTWKFPLLKPSLPPPPLLLGVRQGYDSFWLM